MQNLLMAFLLLMTRTRGGDPWGQCPTSRQCKDKFADGSCDKECLEPECLRDGFDCVIDRGSCNPGHIQYCRDHYANLHCEQGCDSAACGWDGSDCFRRQSPQWAKGTLLLHARVSRQQVTLANSSLLWALSVLLRSPVRLRGTAPLAPNQDLLTFDPQQLTDLLAESSTKDPNGSVLFLQVDNRPCATVPLTCFNHATEAASLLQAMLLLKGGSLPLFPQLKAIIRVRGVREEIGVREEERVDEEIRGMPTWLWPVIGVATGLALALALAVTLAIRRLRRQRGEREGGERVRHRSTVTDSSGAKVWAQHIPHRDQRLRSERDKERNGIKKKKKAKEAEKKRRREPLGEDAIRMRPLKRETEVGSDTDFTQSSMEDINVRTSRRQEDPSICDHRTQEQKHYRQGHAQSPRPLQAPPRGWERSAIPPLLSPPQQTAPVQWCGPDGSVVLIRAVRSGLDRVVLELLRAGVPVNNTDHTGRSALHWACSVNHLSLTRTLTRYGAVVDLQDNKGETSLFLSALHGCYDTARFLLLNGANQDLHDRRGRRPIDVARESLHQQVMELLLAHRVQRGPIPIEPANDMLWEERALMYSPWVASPALPGRSSSFSGVIGHRDMTPPPQSDWSVGRVQCPSPQNWRPQLNQSATALVPPRVMGRSPRPISTLQEVTSEAEDEDRERQQDIPRAATPHFLSPQPAPRQRSFSCTQNALQRHSSTNQTEPTYVVVTDKVANEPIERVIVVPPADPHTQSDRRSIVDHGFDHHSRVESVATSSEQKLRVEMLNNNTANSTQTAL